MSDDNSWRTNLPSSSAASAGDQPVVRPDSLTIGPATLSVDLLTPQLLRFLQSCQNNAGPAPSASDSKVLDGFIPQLTKNFAEASSASTVNELSSTSTASGANTAAAGVHPTGMLSQNSFIISSGPADSANNQNYILISPIGTAAATAPLVSSPTTAVVLPNTTAAAAAVARNLLLNDPSVVAKTTNLTVGGLDIKADIGGDQHHQDVVSSSTGVAGMHNTSSLLEGDTKRPTRPSSSDSSLHGGTPSVGRRRCSGLSSRPVTVGDAVIIQMNRLEQKRARNRDAARRCRERKIRLIETLEKKVSQLSETNHQLKMELEQTQNEVDCLRQFVEQHFKPLGGGGCSLPLKS